MRLEQLAFPLRIEFRSDHEMEGGPALAEAVSVHVLHHLRLQHAGRQTLGNPPVHESGSGLSAPTLASRHLSSWAQRNRAGCRLLKTAGARAGRVLIPVSAREQNED
jgi:hypothetical protein